MKLSKHMKLLLLLVALVLLLVSFDLFYGARNDSEYKEIDGDLYRIIGEEAYPVVMELEETFEFVDNFLQLFRVNALTWDSFVVQSPEAPEVEEFVALRKCIFLRECDFRDSFIEVTRERSFTGTQSLKLYAVGPSEDMVTSKTHIETGQLYFTKGSDLWFRGFFYIDGEHPTTILDFEDSTLYNGPGSRLIFKDTDKLAVELKAGLLKPTYRQPEDTAISFPTNRWVEVRVHLKLSNKNDGVIEVWQNGEKIIDARGKNLPKGNAILDRMQVGITATDKDTTLFIDDIKVSHKEI